MPRPSVKSLVALSFWLMTSTMRALNFFRYLDNEPVVIHCITSFKSPMVSVEEAGGAVGGVWACGLLGTAGNSLMETILGTWGLEGALVTPLLSSYCLAMGQPRKLAGCSPPQFVHFRGSCTGFTQALVLCAPSHFTYRSFRLQNSALWPKFWHLKHCMDLLEFLKFSFLMWKWWISCTCFKMVKLSFDLSTVITHRGRGFDVRTLSSLISVLLICRQWLMATPCLERPGTTSSHVMLGGGGPLRINLVFDPGFGLCVKNSTLLFWSSDVAALWSAADIVLILSPYLTYSFFPELVSIRYWEVLPQQQISGLNVN